MPARAWGHRGGNLSAIADVSPSHRESPRGIDLLNHPALSKPREAPADRRSNAGGEWLSPLRWFREAKQFLIHDFRVDERPPRLAQKIENLNL